MVIIKYAVNMLEKEGKISKHILYAQEAVSNFHFILTYKDGLLGHTVIDREPELSLISFASTTQLILFQGYWRLSW